MSRADGRGLLHAKVPPMITLGQGLSHVCICLVRALNWTL